MRDKFEMLYRHSKIKNDEMLLYILNHRENERSLDELKKLKKDNQKAKKDNQKAKKDNQKAKKDNQKAKKDNQKANYMDNFEMPWLIHSYSDSEPSILEAAIEIKFVKINSEIYFNIKY